MKAYELSGASLNDPIGGVAADADRVPKGRSEDEIDCAAVGWWLWGVVWDVMVCKCGEVRVLWHLKLNGERFGYDTQESTWKATWLAMWKAMWPPCGCHVNRLPSGSSASNSAARGV